MTGKLRAKWLQEEVDELTRVTGDRVHVRNNWSSRRHKGVRPVLLVQFREEFELPRVSIDGRGAEVVVFSATDEFVVQQVLKQLFDPCTDTRGWLINAAVELRIVQLTLSFASVRSGRYNGPSAALVRRGDSGVAGGEACYFFCLGPG